MRETATLIVRRGNAGDAATTSSYEVPYTPGQSVLDGLRFVRANLVEKYFLAYDDNQNPPVPHFFAVYTRPS